MEKFWSGKLRYGKNSVEMLRQRLLELCVLLEFTRTPTSDNVRDAEP